MQLSHHARRVITDALVSHVYLLTGLAEASAHHVASSHDRIGRLAGRVDELAERVHEQRAADARNLLDQITGSPEESDRRITELIRQMHILRPVA